MLVCIDKITCARMLQLIVPRWEAKAVALRSEGRSEAQQRLRRLRRRSRSRRCLQRRLRKLSAQADWLDETIIEIIISEAQNEVVDFKKWGFDIIPHRARIKAGLRD